MFRMFEDWYYGEDVKLLYKTNRMSRKEVIFIISMRKLFSITTGILFAYSILFVSSQGLS